MLDSVAYYLPFLVLPGARFMIQNESKQPTGMHEIEDLKNLDKVLSIINSLSKFINAKKLYTDNNPTLKKFAEGLDSSFKTFFQDENELLLTIEKYQIFWRDQIVYENDIKDESIAFLLFKDGIGEVTFQRSVTFDEINTFVEIIKDEIHNYSPTHDLTERIWRSDFENIHYQVIDDGLTAEQGKAQGADVRPNKVPLEIVDHENLYNIAFKDDDSTQTRAKSASVGAYFYNLFYNNPLVDSGKKEDHIQNLLKSFFTINDHEIKIWEKDLKSEKQLDKLVLLLECLSDFVNSPQNISQLPAVTNILDRLLDHIISEADPSTLAQTLNILRERIENHQTINDIKSLFKGFEKTITNTDFLVRLGKNITYSPEYSNDFFQYLQIIGDGSSKAICALLEHMDTPLNHRKACDTLLAVSKQNIMEAIDSLNTDIPQIARDVVYLFRKLNFKEIPQSVKELIFYPDISVKEEVISLLADIGNEESQLLLQKFLDDEDENVRIKTLNAISKINSPGIKDKIISLAMSKNIMDRSAREQEHTFRSLGILLGTEIIPMLDELTTGNKLRALSKKHKNYKMLAICALEQIIDSESLNLLQKFSSDRDAAIRARANKARRSLEKQLGPDISDIASNNK